MAKLMPRRRRSFQCRFRGVINIYSIFTVLYIKCNFLRHDKEYIQEGKGSDVVGTQSWLGAKIADESGLYKITVGSKALTNLVGVTVKKISVGRPVHHGCVTGSIAAVRT